MDSVSPKCVMIIAGEASGDQHGAKLVSAMREKAPRIFFCGVGGPALKLAGVRILVDIAEITVVGFVEVISKLPVVFRAMSVVKKALRSLKPDLLILIDFPEFNLNIAAAAKKIGVPVLYYVSPQIWAWRQGRVKKIGKRVDHMAVILPFEAEFYEQHGVPVTFVGHPLLDRNPADAPRDSGVDSISEAARHPHIGLLPGSRQVEIKRLLPVMLDTAELLLAQKPELRFILSVAPTIDPVHAESALSGRTIKDRVRISTDPVETIFEKTRLVVAASGTVTLQAAIHGIPMIIIYKVSPISFWLGRSLVRVDHIGLINLIAKRRIVPELVQHQATPIEIAAKALDLLNDADALTALRHELLRSKEGLGGSGASRKVAQIAFSLMEHHENQ